MTDTAEPPAEDLLPASARVRVIDRARAEHGHWELVAEVPVEIGINGVPFTVMMATPTDLEDLGVGLAYSERLITRADAVSSVCVTPYMEGVSVDVRVPAALVNAHAAAARTLVGRTGCGLCGIESLAGLSIAARSATAAMPDVTDESVRAAFDRLPEHQALNRETRSAHAAAWVHDGALAPVREDVGRHNALDKLVGALIRSGRLGESGFVVMTSRLSYELVYKAAAAGAALLATVSAPTTMAVEHAERLGLALACRGPDGTIIRFVAP